MTNGNRWHLLISSGDSFALTSKAFSISQLHSVQSYRTFLLGSTSGWPFAVLHAEFESRLISTGCWSNDEVHLIVRGRCEKGWKAMRRLLECWAHLFKLWECGFRIPHENLALEVSISTLLAPNFYEESENRILRAWKDMLNILARVALFFILFHIYCIRSRLFSPLLQKGPVTSDGTRVTWT